MRSITLKSLFLLTLSILNVMYSFGADTLSPLPQNLYEVYKEILDRGDTVKLRAKTSGPCHFESLTQIIKKSDSTLIVNKITTPCLSSSRYKPSSATHKNTKNGMTMPPIEDFDYTPYSIEVPYSVQNLLFFNIQNAVGRLRIIDLRRDLTTDSVFQYTPTSDYNLSYMGLLTIALCDQCIDEEDDNSPEITHIINAILEDWKGRGVGGNDWFGTDHRYSFGSNPTFLVEHMWGTHITENFIVLIENVQNGLTVNGKEEEDFTEVFIKMAESIKPISPNVFDLNDLNNYKYLPSSIPLGKSRTVDK